LPALRFPKKDGCALFEEGHLTAIDDEKRALRALVRARMPKPGSPEQVAASVAAQSRLAESELLAGARMIALYRALPSECGTAALAAKLEASGRDVCYPVVTPDGRALSFRRGVGVFVSGALGIEEPTGSPVALGDIDAIIVPAIAVDHRGGRIGRGRGHYDATLALCRATSIALVFDAQLVPRVPLCEHDQPVRAVCTESRLLLAASEPLSA
jgi:5-formyltetrahydrofolate cyclo-ligase